MGKVLRPFRFYIILFLWGLLNRPKRGLFVIVVFFSDKQILGEEQRLIQGYRHYGKDFESIRLSYNLRHRTGGQLKDKIRVLQRNGTISAVSPSKWPWPLFVTDSTRLEGPGWLWGRRRRNAKRAQSLVPRVRERERCHFALPINSLKNLKIDCPSFWGGFLRWSWASTRLQADRKWVKT